MKRATMQDVAKDAGVSVMTVSLVARNVPHRVSPPVSRRVRESMEKLGYKPRSRARNRTKGPALAVVMYGTFQRHLHHYFARLLDDVETRIRERGMHLAWVESEYSLADPDTAARRLRDNGIRGLIVIGGAEVETRAWLDQVGRPWIVIAAGGSPEDHAVGPDLFSGGLEATNRLLKLGHRRIAYIGRDSANSLYRAHINGYGGHAFAMKEAGLEAYCSKMTHLEPTMDFERAREIAAQYLALPEPPTAIFAAPDRAALGVLRAASEAGVDVPGQLSVSGFNGDPIGEMSDPPLSCVYVDTRAVAAASVDRLESLMARPDTAPTRTIVPLSYLDRASIAPPA